MSATEEERWARGEPISHAWYEFVDYGLPTREAKQRLRELRREVPYEDVERVEAGKSQYDLQILKFKSEFLDSLLDGDFVAFGRDLSNGVASSIVRIPAGVFRESAEGFTINWGHNEVSGYGTKFIEVRVLPIDRLDVSKSVLSREAGSSIADTQNTPTTANSHYAVEATERRGRPSNKDIIRAAIRHCALSPNHWGLPPSERRACYYKAIKKQAGIDPKSTPGFSEKTIAKYETEHRKLNH
ncbi:hypothetical protein [Oceanicaulis sp. UBA2681]|uniref:hypothetical protein n=1 Tax=Oceanicaulis sp. UBA2681 TaxID=1947007 RepID=UPI00257D7DB1|nr:hypothetical protein [Oceanicaulis sp. UBA2681]|tara:strand:- start:81 stop:806 length:726 start_codon:yes stop_codon:yes gene_type:complete